MKKLILTILLFVSISPVNTFAVDTYTLLEPLPCVEGAGNCEKGKLQTEISFADYVGYVYKFSIALAVFLAIVVIIYAGFEYMLSEALPAKLDAKGRIKSAVTGLLLVFSSYLLLRVIDPRLVQLYTEIPPVKFISSEKPSDFQNKLNTSLTTISEEYKQKVTELKAENANKQSELDVIKAKDQSKLSEEDKIKSQQLSQEIKSNKSQIIRAEIEGGASELILNTINNKEAIYANYEDASAKIDEQLKAGIKQMTELGDLEGAQTLQKQAKFYSEQAKEEGLVYGNIIAVQRAGSTRYAKEDLAKYQREITELTDVGAASNSKIAEIKNDPVMLKTYTVMVQARIEKLQNALNIEPKK